MTTAQIEAAANAEAFMKVALHAKLSDLYERAKPVGYISFVTLGLAELTCLMAALSASPPAPQPASQWRDIASAVADERERCVKVAEQWLEFFGGHKPVAISAQQWACDGIRDIVDAIRNAPLPAPPEST